MLSSILSFGNFGGFAAVSAGKLAMTLAMLATAGTTMGLTFSGAVFTDTEVLASNTFSSGTVLLSTSPTSAVVALSGMAPGSTVTGAVTVSNDGSLELRYAMASQTTEAALAAQLDMTVKTGVTTCTTAGFGTDGTVVYGPGDLGGTTEVAVLGDKTTGAQAGDRTLGASASETLCVQVTLPISTGNAFQGLTSTATFSFYAEQTASNA